MKKIFLTIASVALMSNSNVWAFAGGPFDNGDPGGLLMERGGYYQCQFSFRNGNGYGMFTPDAILGGNLPSASQGVGTSSQQVGIFNRGTLFTQNTNNGLAHNANRSVFYYKGVTYVGACMGFVDVAARQVQGTANATSNDSLTQQTLSQNTGGLINASQAATTTQPVVINTAGFVMNLGWTGKITATRPQLRFRGKGEMTILSPSGVSAVDSLAFSSYQGLIDAIITGVQGSTGVGLGAAITSAQTAIDQILDDLLLRTNGGADALYNDSIKEPVRVTGSRRFF